MRGELLPYLVLMLWTPFIVVAFALLRPQLAVLIAFLVTLLFLPERRTINFTGIPPLGKQEIAALGALIGCLLFQSRRLMRAKPGLGPEIFVLLMMVGAMGTIVTNPDRHWLGTYWAPGLRPKQVMGMATGDLLTLGIPFLMGRAFFRTRRDLRLLMLALVVGGLVYVLPALFEVRMSPVLNDLVYGYSQNSSLMARRFGGWRPMVFMSHGLAVALFLAVATFSALTLWRVRIPIWALPGHIAAVVLGTVLVLCKSTGAILYAALFVPLLMRARSLTLLQIAAVIAALIVIYPMTRAADMFPAQRLVDLARYIHPERAASLGYRFRNESKLLEKARERLPFGWGGFGRSRVYKEGKLKTETVADGYWIITLGLRGGVGLACLYGLLLTPIFLALYYGRRAPPGRDRMLLGGLSLIVAIYALDLLPNGFFTNLPAFLAGSLAGVAPAVARGSAKARPARARTAPPPPVPIPDPPGEPPPARGATTKEVRAATYRRRHLD